jgi:hypothetical protein
MHTPPPARPCPLPVLDRHVELSSTTPFITTSCLIPYSGTNVPAQNEPAMPDTALMYTTSVLSKLQESITESGYHISLLAKYQLQRNITCNLVITTHSLA